ncbi:MAG TPA: hypothetical protein VGG10_05775 [Rhizomicrobium sp.]|jgi:hypothetical protein
MRRAILALTLILIAVPASAQVTGQPRTSGYVPHNPNGTPAVTCQQLMDNSQARLELMPESMAKVHAQSEMTLANNAMASGNEELCKSHMQNALQNVR